MDRMLKFILCKSSVEKCKKNTPTRLLRQCAVIQNWSVPAETSLMKRIYVRCT